MIDVLMLAQNDWANTGWRFSECIKLLGLNIEFYKKNAHKFEYPTQGETLLCDKSKNSRIKKAASEAKVIHFIASKFIKTGVNLNNKKIIVQHGGSRYRKTFKKLNALFNPIVDYSIIQMPELTLLGAKNPVYISFPVDTSFIKPDYKRRADKILIGHYPSSPAIKGTNGILKVINELSNDLEVKDKFKYIGVNETTIKNDYVSWQENLKRMSECDIVIDACNLTQDKYQYGEWGNSAMEAAALGKISITHSLLVNDVYNKVYGKCKLCIANNLIELKNALKHFILMEDKELLKIRQDTRDWLVRNHSFQATANRLKSEVYGKIFDL